MRVPLLSLPHTPLPLASPLTASRIRSRLSLATPSPCSLSHSSRSTLAAGNNSRGTLSEGRPSRRASLLQSIPLLKSASGSSFLGRWCSETRSSSLELAPTSDVEVGGPGGDAACNNTRACARQLAGCPLQAPPQCVSRSHPLPACPWARMQGGGQPGGGVHVMAQIAEGVEAGAGSSEDKAKSSGGWPGLYLFNVAAELR